jgi:hypothetical protein
MCKPAAIISEMLLATAALLALFTMAAGTLEMDVPAGCTVWFARIATARAKGYALDKTRVCRPAKKS